MTKDIIYDAYVRHIHFYMIYDATNNLPTTVTDRFGQRQQVTRVDDQGDK